MDQEESLPASDSEIALSLEQVAPLLQGVEIPVLATQRIHHRADLRTLTIPYPCHIRVAGQGSIGITVANRIDAIAACQTLLSRKANGDFPDYLLVEEDHSLKRQLSLAITLDEQSGEITLRGSEAQQLGASSILDDDVVGAAQICLTRDLEIEDGLNLASRLRLGEAETKGIAHLLEKLYLIMTWTGVSSCCLDALALGQGGEVMVLRGQFKFGKQSPLKRQAQAAMRTGTVIIHPTTFSSGKLGSGRAVIEGSTVTEGAIPKDTFVPQAMKPQTNGWDQANLFVPPDVVRLGEGNIAVISNDFRRTMDTLERCQLGGGAVAAFVNLQDDGGSEPKTGLSELQQVPPGLDAFSLKRQLCQALQALDRLREVKVILINWHGAQLPCRILADALVEYQSQLAQQARRSAKSLSIVVRLTGEGAAGSYQRLKGEEIEIEMNLDGAIARSIGLAHMGRGS